MLKIIKDTMIQEGFKIVLNLIPKVIKIPNVIKKLFKKPESVDKNEKDININITLLNAKKNDHYESSECLADFELVFPEEVHFSENDGIEIRIKNVGAELVQDVNLVCTNNSLSNVLERTNGTPFSFYVPENIYPNIAKPNDILKFTMYPIKATLKNKSNIVYNQLKFSIKFSNSKGKVYTKPFVFELKIDFKSNEITIGRIFKTEKPTLCA